MANFIKAFISSLSRTLEFTLKLRQNYKKETNHFKNLLDVNINPSIIEKHNKDEPPLVKKGNGSPTTGIIPLTIRILSKKLKPITNVQYVPIK